MEHTFVILEVVDGNAEYDDIVPANSETGQAITARMLNASMIGVGVEQFLLATRYSRMFPPGKAGATVADVAERLGVSQDVIRDLMADGELTGWRVKRRVVVSTKSVEDYLTANEWR